MNRGNALCKQAQLDKCKLVQADFHKLPFDDASFDHCYSIEACCHSPDRKDVYREVFRTLKPGGCFVSYEWCLTDKYDASNAAHRLAKKKIEEGDGLPDMCHTSECDAALKAVGFELVDARDAALDANPGGEAWYTILTPSYLLLPHPVRGGHLPAPSSSTSSSSSAWRPRAREGAQMLRRRSSPRRRRPDRPLPPMYFVCAEAALKCAPSRLPCPPNIGPRVQHVSHEAPKLWQ